MVKCVSLVGLGLVFSVTVHAGELNKSLIGRYICHNGGQSAQLELSAEGEFNFLSFENFRGFRGQWKKGYTGKSSGDIKIVLSMRSGKSVTKVYHYQNKGKKKSLFFEGYNCQWLTKETDM